MLWNCSLDADLFLTHSCYHLILTRVEKIYKIYTSTDFIIIYLFFFKELPIVCTSALQVLSRTFDCLYLPNRCMCSRNVRYHYVSAPPPY
jgi:hypothetical protein